MYGALQDIDVDEEDIVNVGVAEVVMQVADEVYPEGHTTIIGAEGFGLKLSWFTRSG